MNRYDYLDAPGANVAHLSHRGQRDAWGHWYSLCGRVVPSHRATCLDDTDHATVCGSCTRRAERRTARSAR